MCIRDSASTSFEAAIASAVGKSRSCTSRLRMRGRSPVSYTHLDVYKRQVINFTLPEDPDDYVHRIGRTGRAGTSGTSISFAGEDDAFALPPIEALIGRKIQCEMPPDELLKPVPRRH